MEPETDEDDWGDFDSNAEDNDYDASNMDIHNTAEQILTAQLSKSSAKYTIHSQNEIKHKTNKIVEEVSQYLDLPFWNCTLLLRHFKWNKDRLFEQFFEYKTEDLLQKCGALTDALRKPPKYSGKNTIFECPMCLNEISAVNTFEIGCSHQICNQCWIDYICTSVKEGKQCINLTCPYYKCNVIIPPQFIIKFIPQNMKDLQYRYQRFALENYIESNLFFSFCPAPNCHYIIEIDPGLIVDIVCQCGQHSCSKCKLSHAHRPCNCKLANKWILKNSSDAENVQWILAKTKQCPKCKVAIEKNHGCNHMVCAKCKYEFCWLCRTDWKCHGSVTGGFYKCNIYEQQKLSGDGSVFEEEKKQRNAQTELERYSFYLQRFDNHNKAGQCARKEMKQRQIYFQQQQSCGNSKNISLNEKDYIIEAFKVIVECRKLLAWTYPIGYYIPSDYQKLPLFIDCQQQLEKYTEHLHEMLEDRSRSHKRNDERIGELNNFMRVTKKFRDNMMDSIEAEISNDLLDMTE